MEQAVTLVRLACSCGVAYEDDLEPKIESLIRGAWERIHAGPGHKPVAQADRRDLHDRLIEYAVPALDGRP